MHFEHLIEIEGVGQVKLSHFPYAPPNPEDEAFLRYEVLRPKLTGEDLLLQGWGMDSLGWLIRLADGQVIAVTTDHGRIVPWSIEDMQAKLEEIESILRGIRQLIEWMETE